MAGPIRVLAQKTLPVFSLRSPLETHRILSDWLQRSLPVAGLPLTAETARYQFDGGYADVNQGNGALWIARDGLWTPPPLDDAAALARLPTTVPVALAGRPLSELAARFTGDDYDGITITPEANWTNGARLVIWRRSGNVRSEYVLDRTESLRLVLRAPAHGVEAVPINGGGGRVAGRAGLDGEWLGLSVAVPRIGASVGQFAVVDRAGLDAQIQARFALFDSVLFDAFLTFRVAGSAFERFLCPFWNYEVVGRIGTRYVPLGYFPLLAVEFPGINPLAQGPPEPQPATRGTQQGVVWGGGTTRKMLVSWLGESAGKLLTSNAARLAALEVMQAAGWTCRDEGNNACAEMDWHRLAVPGVRAADLACYIGHADADGMMFRQPDANWLAARDCRFGGQLKWVVSDACGPLQDPSAGGSRSAFEMWGRAFDGCRAFLGFASPQDPSSELIPRTLAYTLKGQALARAWFQCACETHGGHTAPTWTAGLFGTDGRATTLDDRFDGFQTPAVGLSPPVMAGLWIPVG